MSAFHSGNRNAEAQRLVQAGQLAEAERICRESLGRNRRDAQALSILAQIAAMVGRYSESAEFLKKCIAIVPDEPDLHVRLAGAMVSRAKYRAALSRYDRALKIRRDYAPALAGRAVAFIRLGEWDKARRNLDPYINRGEEDINMATGQSKLPVFIIGMPRTGSTLVEQIIASHPKAHGAGEVIFMHDLVETLGMRIHSNLPYPACITDMNVDDVNVLGELISQRSRHPRHGRKEFAINTLATTSTLG